MAKKGKFNINAVTIPTFKVRLYNGESITVRSIVMKEYRNLLLAKDGSTEGVDHIDAIEQVVKNCIIDDIDIEELTAYDFELIFVKAFEFGTGDSKISVNFQCTNKVSKDESEELSPCASLIKANIDISKIKPSVKAENHDSNELYKQFEIQDGIYVVINKPTFKDTAFFDNSSAEGIITSIMHNFKSIQVEDIETDMLDIDNDDLDELFERISPQLIKEMFEYVSSIPRIQYTLKMKCPSCGKGYTQVLTGIEDFFI